MYQTFWSTVCWSVLSVLLSTSVYTGKRKHCFLKVQRLSWMDKARLATDTDTLTSTFKAQGYRPPARAYGLITRWVPGVQHPAMMYYSYKKTAWTPSHRRFWPASSIKLWAALGAMMRLQTSQISADSTLFFADGAGWFQGPLRALFHPMGNVDYDRMLRIASVQLLNHSFRKRMNLQHLFVQRGYGGTGRITSTPAIRYISKGQTGVLPAIRTARTTPCRSNCTTLFELQDLLRRVFQHELLPKAERLPVSSVALQPLKHALQKKWKWIRPSSYRVLGSHVTVFNKAGSVPGHHLVDNAFIRSGRGFYFLTLATPWPRRQASVAPALHTFNTFARRMIESVHHREGGLPLQPDTGPMMHFRVEWKKRRRTHWIRITIRAQSQHLHVWVGRRKWSLKPRQVGLFRTPYIRVRPGSFLIAARGFVRSTMNAFASVGVRIRKRNGRRMCR